MAVVIETTLGDMTVDLFTEERPQTCKNFLKLCKIKYYNFCLFHSVQANFLAQTGDPTGIGTGGESIYGIVQGSEAKYYEAEKIPKLKHDKPGLLSMVNCGNNMLGSQFFVTLGSDLQSLEEHCVFAEVTEGHDVLVKLNDAICDFQNKPYQDIRITHTVILEDPFEDPPGLLIPEMSPDISNLPASNGRIGADEKINDEEGLTTTELEEMKAEREAKARATILEIVGDLPDADVAPPENVLFVCKLNPVTTDEDLEIIFSRFGKVKSCEVIRDHQTGDSLQYAFVEFDDQKACEQAYLKMDNVLIDDRRIHVDFSQSVAKIKWRGKGRGVQYIDKPDEKEIGRGNESRYSSRRENYRSGERDRDRDRSDRRRDDERRRRGVERESEDRRRSDRDPEDHRRRERRKLDELRRREEEGNWREEELCSQFRWDEERKRRERDERRREDERRHNGRKDERRRDDDRRRDSDRRRNGTDRREKEHSRRYDGLIDNKDEKLGENTRSREKQETREERNERVKEKAEKIEENDGFTVDSDRSKVENDKTSNDTPADRNDKNTGMIDSSNNVNRNACKMSTSPHKRKRKSLEIRKRKRSRRSSSSESSSSESSDSSSSSSSDEKRKKSKHSLTVAKKYYQGGKLVKVVKKKKGHSSDSDSDSEESSDSDHKRKKPKKYKKKIVKVVMKKKRRHSTDDSDSDSSSSDDSDSSKYKKRRKKNSKTFRKKKKAITKKNKKKSQDTTDSSDNGEIDEMDKRKRLQEKYSTNDKCKYVK